MTKHALEIGNCYGRLVVREVIRIRGMGSALRCLCDCGNETTVSRHNLLSGNTRSCGCLFKETNTTHGLTKSRIYVTWKSMIQRCRNPDCASYKNYGGRGIKICKRWEIFDNFLADMGHPPIKHSLERINNDGDYEPSNCRWASYKDQLNNTRHNHMIEAFGRKQSLTLWCEEYGLAITTLKNRIYRAGMTPEEALSAPIQQGYKFSTAYAKAEDAIARRWRNKPSDSETNSQP